MKIDFVVESHLNSETVPRDINDLGAVMVPKTVHCQIGYEINAGQLATLLTIMLEM